MVDKSRRPYLSLRLSLSELFKIPVRWIRDTMGKESSFEKPYLTGEYRTMHLNVSEPSWPTIKVPDIRVPGGKTSAKPSFIPPRGADYPIMDGSLPCLPCGITCWAPEEGECDEWIECHMSIFCTGPIKWNLEAIEGAIQDRVQSGEQGLVVEVFPIVGGYFEDTGPFNEPRIFNIKAGPWASIMPSIQFKVDRNYSHHVILVTATQKDGSSCTEIVELGCCDCEGTVVTIDDTATPDTIAPNGSITVTVKDGCPPFIWSVAGTGYSFASAVTTERTNTLSCVANSGGGCGVDYGPIATITVVDNCGNTATSATGNNIIRNTDGQWISKSTGVCVLSGAEPFIAYGALIWYYKLIQGNKKQEQETMWRLTRNIETCPSAFCDPWAVPPFPPNCIDGDHDIPCTQVGPNVQCFEVIHLHYWEWEC